MRWVPLLAGALPRDLSFSWEYSFALVFPGLFSLASILHLRISLARGRSLEVDLTKVPDRINRLCAVPREIARFSSPPVPCESVLQFPS